MTRNEIEGWLADWVSDELGIDTDDLESDRSLGSYGISTNQLVRLAADIEEFFEEPLEPGIIVKRVTLNRLTRELCLLMDTDEESFDGEDGRISDPEEIQDLGLSI